MGRVYLEDLKLAVRQAGIDTTIESFRETNIEKTGKAVTSIIETDKGIKLFSKCYNTRLYPEVKGYNPLEKQLSDELDEPDLFSYERKILQVINDINKKMAPILYSVVESQQRLFMEFIEENSLQWKFTDLDKKMYKLETEIKISSDKKTTDLKEELQNLRRQKEYWVEKGLSYISRFRKICNENAEKFKHLKIREVKRKTDEAILKDYILRALLYSNPQFKTTDDIITFLKEKNIDIENYSSKLAKYFSSTGSYDEEISLIHGDLGPHHIMSNGKIIDFDEFRRDSYYQDLVRFLKNPFVNQVERKIPIFLADYLLENMLNGGGISKEELERLGIEEKVNRIGLEKFSYTLKRFYDLNLKEDIHIIAVLRKYSPKAIKFFTRGHPVYHSKSRLIKWRLEDIKNILHNLLSEDGRTYLLRDKYSTETIETIRSFFETTGLIKTGSKDMFFLFKGDNPFLSANRLEYGLKIRNKVNA